MDATTSTDISLFEGFRLDRRGGILSRRDEHGFFAPRAIGSRALDILGMLVERQGDLVSRAEIIDAVWPGAAVEDSNLNVQVAALRRILDQDRGQGSCIQTVPGRGYRFVATVTRAGAGPSQTGVRRHRAFRSSYSPSPISATTGSRNISPMAWSRRSSPRSPASAGSS